MLFCGTWWFFLLAILFLYKKCLPYLTAYHLLLCSSQTVFYLFWKEKKIFSTADHSKICLQWWSFISASALLLWRTSARDVEVRAVAPKNPLTQTLMLMRDWQKIERCQNNEYANKYLVLKCNRFWRYTCVEPTYKILILNSFTNTSDKLRARKDIFFTIRVLRIFLNLYSMTYRDRYLPTSLYIIAYIYHN